MPLLDNFFVNMKGTTAEVQIGLYNWKCYSIKPFLHCEAELEQATRLNVQIFAKYILPQFHKLPPLQIFNKKRVVKVFAHILIFINL